MVATIYGAEKDVYLTGTQQLETLGQKLETPDGSIFRFTEMAGTTGIANKLQQSSAPIGNWTNQNLVTAVAVGDPTITFKDGGQAFAVDEAAGGTLHAEESTTLGATYRVKSNSATSGGETVMQLEDGVTALAIVSGKPFTFIKNPWKDVLIHQSPATTLVIGVQRNIIAANGFGWTQSRGVATCLSNGVSVVGEELVASSNVDGATGNKRTTGTATIITTSIVVTHNSGNLLVAADVSVEFTEDPTTDPETRWLGTFTATQFTINVKTDPGSVDQDLSWIAIVAAPVVATCLEAGDTAEFQPIFLKIE